MVGFAVAGLVAAIRARAAQKRRRVLVAVSGTVQDGSEQDVLNTGRLRRTSTTAKFFYCLVWVMDSSEFNFFQGEQYHQVT